MIINFVVVWAQFTLGVGKSEGSGISSTDELCRLPLFWQCSQLRVGVTWSSTI